MAVLNQLLCSQQRNWTPQNGFVVGLLYVVLAVTLTVVSHAQIYYSNEDFADHAVIPRAREPTYGAFAPARELSAVSATTSSRQRRTFVTAGEIVIVVTIAVLTVEISTLYLILHM
jgi:hypothetical protein